MKIYQINFSTGQTYWIGNQSEAIEFADDRIEKKASAIGQPVSYEITPIEVPLLKPQFLDWLNSNFGGIHDI